MKRVVFIFVMFLVLFDNCLYAGVSWVVNRSFEYDGAIGSIGSKTPTGWNEAVIPAGFAGGVTSAWSTDGNYSLNLFSDVLGTFSPGDMITISQDVYLSDVNEIVFDLKLETDLADPWNPDKRSAVVMIDDDEVWSSDSLGSGDLTGEYLDVAIDLNDVPDYRDANSHVLTLGLRSNVSETWPFIEYRAKWDFFGFDTHCDSYGYMNSDFNHDCFVDFIDYGMLANLWMEKVDNYSQFNLDPNNNIIDGNDLEIFFSEWLGGSYGQEDQYIESDFNLDGIVNFIDYAELDFSELSDVNNLPENIETLLEQWLWVNWMFWVEQ